MPVAVRITIDDAGLAERLAALALRACTLKPLMEKIGAANLKETQDRFEAEQDPEGRRWPELAYSTWLGRAGKKAFTKRGRLTKRAQERMNNAKILRDRGHLYGSLAYRASTAEVQIGSNRPYARIHQLGGKAGRDRKSAIPARPYLGVGDAGRAEILDLVRDHLAEAL